VVARAEVSAVEEEMVRTLKVVEVILELVGRLRLISVAAIIVVAMVIEAIAAGPMVDVAMVIEAIAAGPMVVVAMVIEVIAAGPIVVEENTLVGGQVAAGLELTLFILQ